MMRIRNALYTTLAWLQGKKNAPGEYQHIKDVCTAIEEELSLKGYFETALQVAKGVILTPVLESWEEKRRLAKSFNTLYRTMSKSRNADRVAAGGKDRSVKRRRGKGGDEQEVGGSAD